MLQRRDSLLGQKRSTITCAFTLVAAIFGATQMANAGPQWIS